MGVSRYVVGSITTSDICQRGSLSRYVVGSITTSDICQRGSLSRYVVGSITPSDICQRGSLSRLVDCYLTSKMTYFNDQTFGDHCHDSANIFTVSR